MKVPRKLQRVTAWLGAVTTAANLLRVIVHGVTSDWDSLPWPPALLFGMGMVLALSILFDPPEIEETDWQWGIFDHRWYCIGYKHVKGNF